MARKSTPEGRATTTAPGGIAVRVDHRDDAVDRDPAADPRPLERLHQGLRQREAARLDQDVVDVAARLGITAIWR